jgi:peptidoglycan LD-endopeptidase CwlK
MINSTSVDDLTPETRAKANELIRLASLQGITLRITSTYRDAEYQDSLYAKGRTAPGSIVTNLSGSKSIHTSRQAFDVVPIVNGRAEYSTTGAGAERWATIGKLGVQVGLEWGGNWKSFKDFPHFQLPGAKAGSAPAAPPAQKPSEDSKPVSKPADEAKPTGQIYVANVPPIPNRLHSYPSYIYALSLHIMTNEEYNNVVSTQKYTPKNVLIASAGRHGPTFPRNKNFSEDFYFNDFNLTTVIAPNDQSRNTNAIDTKFTIIEPYGFTLVERILKVTEDLGGSNYLDMPYLVQIDFFAVDDAGNLLGSVTDLQKRFPIKLNKLDVRITERGAEYSIQASPFGHAAFESTAVTVPANMEVVSKTVADFFRSVEGTAADTLAQDLAAKVDVKQREGGPAEIVNTQTSVINVDSLGTAINAYYKGLKDAGKIKIADVYRFEFLSDPDTGQDIIGTATFVEEKRNTPKETPMKKNEKPKDAVSMRLSDVGGNQNIYDTTRAIFSINYGTTIEKLLEYVIRNSSYIHDQLVIPDGSSQENYQARREEMKDKPMKWFRIIPKVRLLGFDDIRKIWAKEITYTVKPYKLYNVRNDLAPQGIVVSPVKNYNYIFTGKNDDVINLDINFNALYYSQQTAVRNNMAATAPTGDSLTTNYEYQNAPNYTGGEPPKGINYNAVMPLTMKPVVQNSKAVATGNPTTAKEVAAVDVADSLMSSSQADMIGVKLKIIGDPDFIKQDDIFYQGDQIIQASSSTSMAIDPRLLPNGGSLSMDNGGVYVQILFKVPRDIDDATGFMKYDAGQRNSVFSGLYHVISVVSNFSQGKFTQELELVRLPRQVAFDYISGNNNTSNARPSTSTTPGVLGVNLEPTPTASTTVAGGDPPPSSADAADSAIDQTAGQDQPAAQTNNATPPAESQEQKDLKAVKDTAPTVAISEANQTPPNPPAPKPTEAKKAAEAEFNTFASAVPPAVREYDAALQRIQTINDDIEIREKNIERTNLRLARSDIPEDARKRFNELLVENQTSIDFKRGLLAKEQEIVDANKAANEEFQTKKNELRNIRDNTA